MKIIIGVDDTDNLESRGTGHLVRQLSSFLSMKGLFDTLIIARHQLLVHKDIPYTSHNSSASITGTLKTGLDELIFCCEDFLVENSADGSDVGLCIIPEQVENPEILVKWGVRAKVDVLTEHEAYQIAEVASIYLKGLTGRKTGIIGALAAVGLALSGNDGRVLWMKNLRESKGVFKVNEIRDLIGIDEVSTINGVLLGENDYVELADWNRPVLKKHKTILFVEQQNINKSEYKTASKHYIKSVSE